MHSKLRVLVPLFISMSFMVQAQTPTRLSDINTSGDANPQNFFTYGNNLFFLAKLATDRQEWYTLNTLTNAVTQKTNDHSQLNGSVIFRTPVRIGDNVFVSSSKNNNTTSNLYFSRFDLTTGTEPQWNPSNATSPNDPLAFVIDSATSDVYCTFSTTGGNQIFKWNHTTGNVSQFSTIGNAGVGSTGNNTNGALMIIGNYLYTTSYGGSGNNYNYPIRISLSDGSTYTEILSSGNHLYEANRYTKLNGKLYFTARSGSNAGPVNLYCYDPSNTTLTALTSYTQTLASGNVNITAIAPDNTMLVPVIYYNTNPVQGEMLRVDPATNSVTHINGGILTGNTYTYAFTNGNYAYFSQASGSNRVLVKYDMTNGTTTTVIPASAGFTALINFFAATDGKAYFSGNTAANGAELWSYDMNTDAVNLVSDIYTGATGSAPGSFTQIGTKLYFAAKDATYGRELYSLQLTSSPLDVKLESFAARNNGSVNIINWKNASEEAGDGMQLQASVDGKTFHTIASFQASGKPNAEYEYRDEHPVSGMNYYRLMMNNKNGSNSYSNIATAFVKANVQQPVIYPNPVANTINIYCGQSGSASVINAGGVTELQFNVHSGTNNIDVSKLAPGSYLLQYNADQQNIIQRFVKQ